MLLVVDARRIFLHRKPSESADKVSQLVEKRRREAVTNEEAAEIEYRSIAIWVGLVFELAIHVFAGTVEKDLSDLYDQQLQNATADDALAQDQAPRKKALIFAVNLLVALVFSTVFVAILYVFVTPHNKFAVLRRALSLLADNVCLCFFRALSISTLATTRYTLFRQILSTWQ